jgi:hypothetical protein
MLNSKSAACLSASVGIALTGCSIAAGNPPPRAIMSGSAQAPVNAFPGNFNVFNGNRYANADYFDSMGLVPLTSIYDVWKLSCDATKCYHVPTEKQFKQALTSYVSQFRSSTVIVFDFENIVIDAARSEAQASNEVALFKQFIAWAREAYPNARLGMYDYDFNPKFRDIRAQLYQSAGFDFFAPTMYQRWPDHAAWRANLHAMVANDRAIAPALPIYAYVSPYMSGLTSNGFLGDSEWLAELSDAGRAINGVIVWTQSASFDSLNTNQSWLADLRRMMSGTGR